MSNNGYEKNRQSPSKGGFLIPIPTKAHIWITSLKGNAMDTTDICKIIGLLQ